MKKVFVSGCFDMLHSGHVAFIEAASRLGEVYVGIGSDRTIEELKGHKPINNQTERLFMVQSLKKVKEAWINSGSGKLDFIEEVKLVKPDILFVNVDGDCQEKKDFCDALGIQYIVGHREPLFNLDARSTTDLVRSSTIPFRIDIAGGWLDQHFVNELHPGPVLTISVEPDIRFNSYSGLSSSTRRKAIDMWGHEIPIGNKEKLARQLFACENEPLPNKRYISGSQDAIGIVFPGINKLNYDNDYWPYKIDTILREDIISWLESVLWLVSIGPRDKNINLYENTNIKLKHVSQLAIAAENAWDAILEKNTEKLGIYVLDSFKAQLKMFPDMINDHVWKALEKYIPKVAGYKLAGCGGGGYLVMISDEPVQNGFNVRIRRE